MNEAKCIFCDPDAASVVLENGTGYARWDAFPVSPGHLLVIPRRHFASLFDATPEEMAALWELVRRAKELIDGKYHPDGYNIGVNVGAAAGQTVMHLHIHVIPRYAGDIMEPEGGVRGVVPGRRQYG